MRHYPPVHHRRGALSALLLLLLTVATVPELVWAQAHLLEHDGHHHEAEAAGQAKVHWLQLVEIVVHGHHHPEGTPEHDHRLLPSPPVRQEAPRHVEQLGVRLAGIPAGEPSPVPASAQTQPAARLAGASPPLVHLLCVLLI